MILFVPLHISAKRYKSQIPNHKFDHMKRNVFAPSSCPLALRHVGTLGRRTQYQHTEKPLLPPIPGRGSYPKPGWSPSPVCSQPILQAALSFHSFSGFVLPKSNRIRKRSLLHEPAERERIGSIVNHPQSIHRSASGGRGLNTVPLSFRRRRRS